MTDSDTIEKQSFQYFSVKTSKRSSKFNNIAVLPLYIVLKEDKKILSLLKVFFVFIILCL